MDREAEEELTNHVNGDSSNNKLEFEEEDQDESLEQDDEAQVTKAKSEDQERDGDGKEQTSFSEGKYDEGNAKETKEEEWNTEKDEESDFLKAGSEGESGSHVLGIFRSVLG